MNVKNSFENVRDRLVSRYLSSDNAYKDYEKLEIKDEVETEAIIR